MKKLLLMLLSLVPAINFAQVVIGTGTELAQANTPAIMIQSGGNLVNNNSSFDFGGVNLNVSLNGPATAITGNWAIKRFRINADAAVTVNGNLTVTEVMDFSSGVLRPASGKILFTGNSLTAPGSASYVDGPFYQTGGGNRQFPVGTGSTYAPISFFNIQTTGEVGAQVFNAAHSLQPNGVDVLEILPGRYWQILTADPASVNSPVNISLNGLNPGTGTALVIQAQSLSSTVENLGNSTTNLTDISSARAVTAPYIAIGKQAEVIVRIHDLISPFTLDTFNDGLFIENIDQFAIKRVTLMDRWGVLVQQWEDYTNDNNYDFSKLAPGSYICVLEYGNEDQTSKISQMVTVLKTN